MTGLPRREIPPLPPPPGAFDTVLKEVRHRRHRRATTLLSVLIVFLAGLVGGAALDPDPAGVRDTIVAAARDFVEDQGAPATTAPRTSAAVTPEVDAPAKAGRKKKNDRATRAAKPPAAASPGAADGPPQVNGVAVDAAGQPVAGLYVYPGRTGHDRFLATRSAATRTAADGTFAVPCTGTPVLLSPWPVNAAAGSAAARAVWAATFVGGGVEAAGASDAPCSADGSRVTTTVLRGSTVEGTATMPEDCADAQLPLWLWLHSDRSLTVRLSDLRSGDSFAFGGLPPGQHTLGANGERTTVTVGGGATSTQDVTFSCEPGTPPETPEPSPTKGTTPKPTPSETPTQTPASSPTTPLPSDPESTAPSPGAPKP